jgi:tRNA pseudouridine38-40 synthase
MTLPDHTNYRITVGYDGRAFFGWQRLKDQPSVQGAIEDALLQVFSQPCLVHAASRTDRGAHAEGQVFSVTLPGTQAPEDLLRALAAAVPATIRVHEVAVVDDDFHAMKDARGKIYRYEIWNAPECPAGQQGLVWHIPGPLDVGAMHAACQVFVGEQDFASFATRPNFRQKSTRRHMRRVELATQGPRISITLEADGFLYKMVRNIVRAIVKVGEGRTTVEDLERIAARRDRSAAPGTAPASGLYLERVLYD